MTIEEPYILYYTQGIDINIDFMLYGRQGICIIYKCLFVCSELRHVDSYEDFLGS